MTTVVLLLVEDWPQQLPPLLAKLLPWDSEPREACTTVVVFGGGWLILGQFVMEDWA